MPRLRLLGAWWWWRFGWPEQYTGNLSFPFNVLGLSLLFADGANGETLSVRSSMASGHSLSFDAGIAHRPAVRAELSAVAGYGLVSKFFSSKLK